MSKKIQTCQEHGLLSRIIKSSRWKQPLERFLKCEKINHKYIFHIFAESMCLKRVFFNQMEKMQMKTRGGLCGIEPHNGCSLFVQYTLLAWIQDRVTCPICFSLVVAHMKPMILEILSSNMVKSEGMIFEYSRVDTTPKRLRNSLFLAVTLHPRRAALALPTGTPEQLLLFPARN